MMLIIFLAEDGFLFPQSFRAWNIFCQGEMPIRFSTNFCLILGRDALSPWSKWHPVPLPSPFIRVPYEPEEFSTLSKWWCSVSSSSFHLLFFSSGILGSMEASWSRMSSWATRKQWFASGMPVPLLCHFSFGLYWPQKGYAAITIWKASRLTLQLLLVVFHYTKTGSGMFANFLILHAAWGWAKL